MKAFRALSAVEQLAAHLREEIRNGGVEGQMPGVAQLVRRLGVGTKTVVAALEHLKRDGILEMRGERRRSRIVNVDHEMKAGLRVRLLLYEESDAHDEHIVRLGYRLEQLGHDVAHATRTLKELNFDVKRVARMVEKDDGDAWVILAGSRAVLEWFAAQPLPAFAIYGRQNGLPLARLAVLKSPAVAEALRQLVSLGHRRIVMLARQERRKPTPGLTETQFLEELKRLGVKTGLYNLPDWEDDAPGFHRCLDSLFQHTPPTALFAGEPALFFAAQQHLLGKGLVIPRDVSMVTLEDHPAFDWFEPKVSHIRIDRRRWVPRVVQWVDNLANNKTDRRETLIRAEFIAGGTIGPAKS